MVLQEIGRQFAQSPELRQQYEIVKAKLPRVRAILREYMHFRGYYLSEECENVGFTETLKAGWRMLGDTGKEGLFKEQINQLFVEH